MCIRLMMLMLLFYACEALARDYGRAILFITGYFQSQVLLFSHVFSKSIVDSPNRVFRQQANPTSNHRSAMTEEVLL